MSDQRFEAAKAAMQGTLANHMRNGRPSEYANEAVQYADALLAELDKTKPKSTTTDSEQMLSVYDEVASWPVWKQKAARAAFCKAKPNNTDNLLLSALKEAENVLEEYLATLQKAYTYGSFNYGHKVLAQIKDAIAKAEQKND